MPIWAKNVIEMSSPSAENQSVRFPESKRVFEKLQEIEKATRYVRIVSNKTGIDYNPARHMSQGNQKIDDDSARRIATAYGISLEWITTGKGKVLSGEPPRPVTPGPIQEAPSAREDAMVEVMREMALTMRTLREGMDKDKEFQMKALEMMGLLLEKVK